MKREHEGKEGEGRGRKGRDVRGGKGRGGEGRGGEGRGGEGRGGEGRGGEGMLHSRGKREGEGVCWATHSLYPNDCSACCSSLQSMFPDLSLSNL